MEFNVEVNIFRVVQGLRIIHMYNVYGKNENVSKIEAT